MTTIPHWNDGSADQDLWDFVFLGEHALPGVCSCEVELPGDLDFQKPKGSKGSTMTDNGDNPAKVTITMVLWLQEQVDQWFRIVPELRAKSAKGARQPQEIIHPNALMHGIDAVVVDNIRADHPDAINGWTITLDCVEWFPAPKKAKGTTNAAKSASSTGEEVAKLFGDNKAAPTDKQTVLNNLAQ